VTFYNGTQTLGNGPVDQNGKASLTVASKAYLPVGTHTLSAVYSGSSLLKSSVAKDGRHSHGREPVVHEAVEQQEFMRPPSVRSGRAAMHDKVAMSAST
jgi:hypothetical protein